MHLGGAALSTIPTPGAGWRPTSCGVHSNSSSHSRGLVLQHGSLPATPSPCGPPQPHRHPFQMKPSPEGAPGPRPPLAPPPTAAPPLPSLDKPCSWDLPGPSAKPPGNTPAQPLSPSTRFKFRPRVQVQALLLTRGRQLGPCPGGDPDGPLLGCRRLPASGAQELALCLPFFLPSS